MFAARAAFMAGAKLVEITVDAVNAGKYVNNTGTQSFTHTATSGAYVLMLVGSYQSYERPNSVAYGGESMTSLGFNNTGGGNGSLWMWGKSNVSGGSATVSIPSSAGAPYWSTIISIKNVSSVSAPVFVRGTSSLSQTVSCNPGQLILQAFGYCYQPSIPTVTGGTSLFLKTYANAPSETIGYYGGLSVRSATSSTTFTSTEAGYGFAGGALVFS